MAADLPTPRALPQILGGMVDDYLARLDTSGIAPGLKSLKPGSSVLAFLEAVGQSQARGSQDLMNVLEADDIDRAKGQRLDRIGRAERVLRRGETFARGFVTISDSRFEKVQTRIYAGQPAPIPGSNVLYATDASGFDQTGSIYIGRGTSNGEGPLPYIGVEEVAQSYWRITLAGATTKYHSLAESIVLAQQGDRTVNIGQAVGTPQGSASAALFTTKSRVTLLDGEDSVADVPVTCQQSGTVGNVAAGGISFVQAAAFTGMKVTNPLAIQNGLAVEDDDHYRERIKAVRANRAKATPKAIMARAYGIQAPDENSTITSAKLVVRSGRPSTLYIDDGAGYEEKDLGINQEVLIDSANGGETTFRLVYGRPVAKATIKALRPAPYRLAEGMTLAVEVGGTRYEHWFSAYDFANIANASAYEVVASINKNSAIGFNARAIEGGKYLVLFARQETNEDLAVVPAVGTDAAAALALPTGRVDTLRLYLNDRLLFKDGSRATIQTQVQSRWTGLQDGETLELEVDGTGLRTYIFNDADFVAAGTGFATVNEANSLESWAAVLNAKLPGVTATVNGAALELVSNLGASARASLQVGQGSSLVLKGVFDTRTLAATGRANDYTLDRNLGSIELSRPLAAGDRLTAGSPFTRAYLESGEVLTTTLPTDARLWFAIDGGSRKVSTGLDATHTLALVAAPAGPSPVRRLTATLTNTGAAAYPFTYLKVGDWAIVQDDSLFPVPLGLDGIGSFRVSAVDPAGQWFEVDARSSYGGISVVNQGTAYRMLSFYRSTATPQQVTVPAGTYSAFDIAAVLSEVLTGAQATVYETTRVRVTTNTYGREGDVALLTFDDAATALMFKAGASANDLPHFAAVESGNSETGTPAVFIDTYVLASDTETSFTFDNALPFGDPRHGSVPAIHWLRPLIDATSADRYGQNNGRTDQTSVLALTEPSVTLRSVFSRPNDATVGADRFIVTNGFHLGPESKLDLVLDRDPLGQGYSIPMFRRLVPDPTMTLGSAMRFMDADLLDQDGNPVPLIRSFGTAFNFSDFVLYSHARGATHGADSSKSAMWRMREFWNTSAGALRYTLPKLPGQKVAVTWTQPAFNISIVLPSGGRKTVALQAPEKVRVVAGTGGSLLITGYRGLTLTRAGATVTCTPTLPAGVTTHGYQAGETVFLSVPDASFPGGFKTITGVTGTTFTYTEGGGDLTVSYPTATLTWTVGVLNFQSSLVNGDILSLQNVGTSTDRTAFRIATVNPTNLVVADDLVGFAGTMAHFQVVGSADDIQFFSLDQNVTGTGSAITADWLVQQVAALPNSPVLGVLGGDGTGVIDRPWTEDSAATCDMRNGILHVGSSAALPTNYTLTMKYPVSGPVLDWANEEFRLVPTTVKNVVDFLSAPAVTGLSLSGASVMAVAAAGRVQLASGTLGSASAIQVMGGSANSARFVIQGSAVLSEGPVAKVSVRKTNDLKTLTTGMYVSIDGLQSLPKQMGWTSLLLGVTANQVKSSGAPPTPTWSFSDSFDSPVFAGDIYVERHGRFTAITALGDGFDLSSALTGDFLTIPSSEGAWSKVASAAGGKTGAAFVTMANGHVLIVGGGVSPSNTVTEYDPTAQTFTARAVLPQAVLNATACLLNDGRVLVAGGQVVPGVTEKCYVYTSDSNSWANVGDLHVARTGHTLTVMSDGLVLACAGETAGAAALSSFEVLDPAALTWTLMANSTGTPRSHHFALRFGGDQVILFGGHTTTGAALANVDAMTNYGTRVWAPRGNLTTARGVCTAVPLANSKVLVFGGGVAACDIYDTGTFTSAAAATMGWASDAASFAKLQDGRVLAIGGSASRAVEAYDPDTDSWSWFAALPMNVQDRQPSLVPAAGAGPVTIVGVLGGNWVSSTLDPAASGPQAGNVGTWRIVAASERTVWVENDVAVEERIQVGHLLLRAYGSVMPGDTFQVGTQKLGIKNQGSFRVNSIDLNDRTSFVVTGMTDVAPTNLAADVSLVQVVPALPTRVIMCIQAIVPNAANQDLVDLILIPGKASYVEADLCLDRISEAGGCVVTALDRLAFPTDIMVGSDAYRYNTGLLGEANHVLYGDESDRATYPGYIGAGQVVNVAASLIRRVKVSLAVRIRAGSNPKVRIQNAVAKVINAAGPNPIPLSDIIEAVKRVDGVVSVVLLSPTYDALHDTIPVQPYEMPRVLDIDSDIQVGIIGQ